MKITITVETKKSIPRWHPFMGYVCSVFYAIIKCKIGRKIIPNVTRADVVQVGGIDPHYGKSSTLRPQEPTKLELEIDGKVITYKVLSVKNIMKDANITEMRFEVKKP